MRRIFGLSAIAAGAALAPALQAQEITAGGVAELRAGFGSNPYLVLNSPGSSALIGGSLTGWLQRRSETATTRLTAVAAIDGNLRLYGRTENYRAYLTHQQTLSSKLSLNVEGGYQDSINPQGFDTFGGSTTDLLSIGQRTHAIYGTGLLQWQPTSRDNFYVGPTFNRTTYPSNGLSDFTQYGLRGGYLRQVTAKLKLGVDVTAQKVDSRGFPNSTSYQGGLRMVYDYNAIWRFDATVGLIHQNTEGFGSSTTVGFTAEICGTYPRYRICVDAARQSAPSGFGGLRTDNRVHATIDYSLSARSHVNAGAVYDVSDSSGISIVPKQKFWELNAGYSRTLTERLSAGVTGRYQNRDYGNILGLTSTNASGYTVTANISYKFGRLD